MGPTPNGKSLKLFRFFQELSLMTFLLFWRFSLLTSGQAGPERYGGGRVQGTAISSAWWAPIQSNNMVGVVIISIFLING